MSQDTRDSDPGCGLTATFKAAMRRFVSTVTLITAGADGRRFGMSATAVSSVSAEPPSLLVCVNRAASIHEVIRKQGRFCVNFLGREHAALVGSFSGSLKGEDRFLHGVWDDIDGLPVLRDAPANLICNVVSSLPHGTHTVFIGDVQQVRLGGRSQPLVHENGRLALTTEIEAVA